MMELKRRSPQSYHSAMELCPDARLLEFIAPLKLAGIATGEVLVDFPSGAGYLRRALSRLELDVQYYAVEQIHEYEVMGEGLKRGEWDRLPFKDDSVDVVLSLAALHHLYPERDPFYNEAWRVLNNQGRLVIADVAEGTGASRFLSEFVGNYSPEGHEAQFFARLVDTSALERCGFSVVNFDICDLPWTYPDRDTAIRFCRDLFRLPKSTDAEIWEALNYYLGITENGGRIEMQWQLALIRADKVL